MYTRSRANTLHPEVGVFARCLEAALLAMALCTPVGAQEEYFGDFVVGFTVDVMTDEVTSQAFTVDPDYQASMTWACKGGVLSLYLLGDVGVADQTVGVQWRFDSKPASEVVRWDAVMGAGLMANDDDVARFTAAAKPATTLRLRVTSSGPRGDYTFSLMGLTAALERLGCPL